MSSASTEVAKSQTVTMSEKEELVLTPITGITPVNGALSESNKRKEKPKTSAVS